MALRRSIKPDHLLAKLVTGEKVACAFCRREVDNELIYGKLYAIGNIQCHYFCVLLSCCLIQKGRDDEGLFGFLYKDILIELERSKKHRCSYCGRDGATLGCCVTQCRKQFHLPCGRERNAVSLFYGNYKSYCQMHAPKQKIPESIMAKAKLRMKDARNVKSKNRNEELKNSKVVHNDIEKVTDMLHSESVCVICYEEVDAFPSLQTFWPPCCARDAWFHRSCLQRMALSAGVHYLRCPLCNDKDSFHDAIISQGYYIPDRDASWELEQNAFAEIYECPLACTVDCKCEMGRTHNSESGLWEIKLCILCGSGGAHAGCVTSCARLVCAACAPAAPPPADLEALARTIEAVILAEQNRATEETRRRPMMRSRMSLRRTKGSAPSVASASNHTGNIDKQEPTSNVTTSRHELNLKTPRKPQNQSSPVLQKIENKLLSPTKLLEQSWRERMSCMGVENVELNGEVVEEIRRRFMKPKPFSEKRKIVNVFLDEFFENILKEPKQKEKIKEWCSPRKCSDIKEELIEIKPQVTKEESNKDNSTNTPQKIKLISPIKIPLSRENSVTDDSSSTFTLPSEFIADNNSDESLPVFNTPKKLKTVDIHKDSSLEISEHDHIINIDVVKMDEKSQDDGFFKILNVNSPVKNKKCAFKFSPLDKEKLQNNTVDIDLESFKNHYLTEVGRDFKDNNKNLKDNSKDTGKGNDRKDRKRKLPAKQRKNGGKKRKIANENAANIVLNYNKGNTDNVELSVDSKKERRRKTKKKIKTKVSIRDNNIQVKIKWRKERVKLKITESQKKKIKKPVVDNKSNLKQYVLQYFQDQSTSKDLIMKPAVDVPPLGKKTIKLEKSPDHLVQTSIHRFFTTRN